VDGRKLGREKGGRFLERETEREGRVGMGECVTHLLVKTSYIRWSLLAKTKLMKA
jgi:hypothetical protein